MDVFARNLTCFENYLQKNLPKAPSFHPHYEKALKSMFLAGGKRFRPMLLLKVVEHEAPLLFENALPVAMAVEMMHTYSLIHDDLPAMDNSSLRRGRATLHVEFDEVTAILVGDALNTHSFSLLASAPLSSKTRIGLVDILSSEGGATGMVLGQAIDCHFENQCLSVQDLEFLHIRKTAKLIAASLKMGMVIANAPISRQKLIEEFGLKLGLAFQIHDDLIDATKSEKEVGKPTGNDGSKNSFTNLLGIDGALKRQNSLVEELTVYAKKIDGALGEELAMSIATYFTKG